ncbi:MAG: hypothetical protein U1F71_04235 [Verrucomicrobiaceae bacterium]
MNEPSAELQERVRASFTQREPERVFRGCKVAEDGATLIVRIYSYRAQFPNIMPTPYQVYRFDPASDALTLLSAEEAAPYTIANYK